eukprot:COSAG02_NODE_3619_length_6464_cov_15.210683_4_plen_47_part_00
MTSSPTVFQLPVAVVHSVLSHAARTEELHSPPVSDVARARAARRLF